MVTENEEPKVDDQAEMRSDPEPQDRERRPDTSGVAIEVEGKTWTLARPGLAVDQDLAAILNQIHDSAVIRSSIPVRETRSLAFYLLVENYRLVPDEARRIVWQADPTRLAQAVYEAVIPPPIRRTYTAWARSALLANGLVPEKVPPDDLANVLRHLVETERAISREDFTEAGEAAQVRAGFMHIAKHGLDG